MLLIIEMLKPFSHHRTIFGYRTSYLLLVDNTHAQKYTFPGVFNID